jgi:hypothetical protein
MVKIYLLWSDLMINTIKFKINYINIDLLRELKLLPQPKDNSINRFLVEKIKRINYDI